jgi:hypothetical protein
MHSQSSALEVKYESWYKYGIAILMFEMAIAVAVCGYSLYLTFHGLGGFPGK